jgi:hypothetical protein
LTLLAWIPHLPPSAVDLKRRVDSSILSLTTNVL